LSDIAAFKSIPDVSFIDFLTLEQVQEDMKADYSAAYKTLTGNEVTLAAADPVSLIISAVSLQIYQALQCVDRAGKQDLLKYSYGEFLDNLAARIGITRKAAGYAITTLRFTLSSTQSGAIGIPAGTRACTEDNVYFITNEYAEIAPAGYASTTLRFTATGANEGISIPAETRAAAADGTIFKTTQAAQLEKCAAATTLLRFTLKSAAGTDVIVPANTPVNAADGYTFFTDEEAEIPASEYAVTTLRLYPPSTGDTIVPAGTEFSTSGGVTFTLDEDTSVDSSDSYTDAPATAKLPGTRANGVTVNTALAFTVSGITSAKIASTSAGGTDSLTTEASATAQAIGAAGNAYAVNSITVLPSALAAQMTATNPEPSAGGSGSLSVDIPAMAVKAGEAWNGYEVGTINVQTDPIDGIASVGNTSKSAGGYGTGYVDVAATAAVTGAGCNGYDAGAVNTMVDPIAYVGSVANTSPTSGGTDTEDDDTLTERVFRAPEGYSVAGPFGAYEALAKEFRSDIGDVQITSPTPCAINVYVLLSTGNLPTASDLAALEEYLSSATVRPLTDKVTCLAPSEVIYNIALTYYIASSDSAQAAAIQQAVDEAVNDYVAWQRAIGTDINPTDLIYRIRKAGAKRVVLTAPTYTVVEDTSVPAIGTRSVVYGGIEDD
jgi:phage-related baseplate assembly protein